jgi:hypothetical protein
MTTPNTPANIDREKEFAIIESLAIQGDLSKLNSEQRVMYYNRVCESMNLNPLTKPFSYIQLGGKFTLYATKDCTEQLRKLNGISIESLESKMIDDVYIVKARARDKHGRVDESTGALVIGNLRGEAKANAIMKCETKAKRRVTLSISGLGWCDESEVETIPNATKPEVCLETGNITNNQPKPIKSVETYHDEAVTMSGQDDRLPVDPKITQEQQDKLIESMRYADDEWRKNIWKWLHERNIFAEEDILQSMYPPIMNSLAINIEKNKVKA